MLAISPTYHVSVVTALTFFLSATDATAAEPPVGTVRTIPAVSASIAVRSTAQESKRLVYSPPPGWYVRSHRVAIGKKSGTVAYTVSTLPADWNWTSDDKGGSITRTAAVIQTGPTGLPATGGRAELNQSATTSGHQASTSSHHALVVEVTVTGEGFLSGGAGVDMTVFAELVYVGKR